MVESRDAHHQGVAKGRTDIFLTGGIGKFSRANIFFICGSCCKHFFLYLRLLTNTFFYLHTRYFEIFQPPSHPTSKKLIVLPIRKQAPHLEVTREPRVISFLETTPLSTYAQTLTSRTRNLQHGPSTMIWYRLVPLLLLLTDSLETSYGDDECQYNSDCKNGTHACCHRRYTQTSVCRKTRDGESCDISWDCGTGQKMFCCDDHICRNSWKMCPADYSTPGWITAIVVIAVICAVLGIGGTIFCIYHRNRRRSSLHNDLLVKETVPRSTYGAS